MLAGRYFGGILKICHLAEFIWQGWSQVTIMIFTIKWLLKCTGNLTRPWASFGWVRTKSMMKCNWKLYKSLLQSGLFSPHGSVQQPHTRCLDHLPRIDRQANSFPTTGVQNILKKWCPRTQLSLVNSMLMIRLACLAAWIMTMILQ